jgi:type II secretory ATPase GspE/PulE/Tfp pilus assembly ATPase PilB-like protein
MNINKVPQDGRFQFDTTVHGDTESVDVRVNTLP